jgi:hypothetical protein
MLVEMLTEAVGKAPGHDPRSKYRRGVSAPDRGRAVTVAAIDGIAPASIYTKGKPTHRRRPSALVLLGQH